MKDLMYLVKRNIKVYFNDKGLFLTSLITPLILLVLYTTFLKGVFKESYTAILPESLNISEGIINGLVSGQLMSSLLAVCCVTVAFSSNFIMVKDKINGVTKDLNVSPVKKYKIILSYFIASFVATIIVNISALIICLVYTYYNGWHYSLTDIMYLTLDVSLLTLFGCILSSVINSNLKSEGHVTAVSAMVSSIYGFLCGAYMPISSFGVGLQKFLSFLPGTYATSLIRNHSLVPILNKMNNVDPLIINGIKKSVDCTIEFNGNVVSILNMYLVLIASILVLLVVYVFINKKKRL